MVRTLLQEGQTKAGEYSFAGLPWEHEELRYWILRDLWWEKLTE